MIRALTFIGATCVALFCTSCDRNNEPRKGGEAVVNDFHIAFANGTGSNSATVVQGVKDLSTGAVSSRVGFSLESSRTARIFASTDGKYIYSLNYTVGTIEKLQYNGGDKYERLTTIDASIPLGVKTIRFTKLDDKEGAIHYIKATPEGEKAEYKRHKMEVTLAILDLESMQLKSGFQKAVPFYLPEPLASAGYYITRIDSPVRSGDKLYYGAAVSLYNKSNGKASPTDKTFTLVVNYNDLSKVAVVATDHVRGATNGYRTPTQHTLENGAIVQLVSGVQANKRNEVHLVQLKNGQYDTSYDLNLSALLGKETRSDGFFYAGNGIAYVPYEDYSTERKSLGVDPNGKETFSYDWRLARVDLNSRTAIDLEVPAALWLRQCQNAVVRNGFFYIALAPIGKVGHVYIFDMKSTSKSGRLGAALEGTGADQYFIGIY